VRDRDDALADLEEGANGAAGTQERFVSFPVPDTAKGKQMLKPDVVERPAKIECSADT
tara:strand:+ start:304 stop:477 length:174 start_codon:yes stop_codon:yes gene_type:complete